MNSLRKLNGDKMPKDKNASQEFFHLYYARAQTFVERQKELKIAVGSSCLSPIKLAFGMPMIKAKNFSNYAGLPERHRK